MSLRELDIIEDLKPLGGGWRYMQKTKSGGLQRIPMTGGAKTARALVEDVRMYRINEGIPMGEPEHDIAEYIRKVSPQNDMWNGRKGIISQPRPENYVKPIERLRLWLDEIGPTKPRIMTPAEATERADICVKCPYNIRWKISNCSDCNKTVEYLGLTMRDTLDYPLDDALHGCRVHGIYLPLAVFIDRDDMKPRRSPEAPASCWMPT